MQLNNKIALVTGASSGIGEAVAREAAAAGARVVLVSNDRAGLERVVHDVQGTGGWARSWVVDLTEAEATANACAEIEREIGVPDVIVNNAGKGRWRYLDETGTDELVGMMAVPYFAAAFVTRAFLPRMLTRRSGFIVNVTSFAAFMPWAGATGYTAARWAMRGFNQALRADLHGSGVRAMLATFAQVDSPYWEHNPGSIERVPSVQRMIPVLTPEQAGRAIIRGVLRDQRQVESPWMLKVLLTLGYWFPAVSRWLVYRTGHHRQQAGQLG